MNRELIYQLSLSIIPGVGPVQAKLLLEHLGSAEAIFKAKESQLKKIEGIGIARARSIKTFNRFHDAEKEVLFIEQYRIQTLFITDPEYPRRLLNCYDSPTILFYKGEASLNHQKIIGIVGTRHHTAYGRQLTETLVRDLSSQKALIVSGLAFGIDTIAHKAAIKNQVPTVGVLAHGLDILYPSQNKSLAKEMIQCGGGLLTEFRSNTSPDKHHFPTRNRIVAGMCDAIVVVETGLSGGSMITAELANGYNKDVFAYPGKTIDQKSAGCNHLIQNNKAVLLTKAEELITSLNWEPGIKEKTNRQRVIFPALGEHEKLIVDVLAARAPLSIDDLNLAVPMSSSAVAAAILNLELQNVIISLPGKIYRLA
jgi:DNA processing protein